MIGYNGGRLGKINPTSTSLVTGVFKLRENATNKLAGLWPVITLDPFWLQTAALFSFENNYLDKSPAIRTAQTFGSVSITNTGVKYGVGSYSTNGGILWWVMTAAPGTDSFTIEAWVKPTASTSATDAMVFGMHATGGGDDFQLLRDGTSSNPMALTVRVNTNPQNTPVNVTVIPASASTVLPDGVWSHVAVVKSGNNYTLFINGAVAGTGSNSYSITGSTMYVGRNFAGGQTLYAVYDEIRYTLAARYTGAFTPSTSPWPVG